MVFKLLSIIIIIVSEKVPRSVSKINVTTNSQQGLDIHWSPLDKNQHTHGKHSYCAVCHPQENEKAKVNKVYFIIIMFTFFLVESQACAMKVI